VKKLISADDHINIGRRSNELNAMRGMLMLKEAIQGKTVLAAAIFIASFLVLALKLLSPTPVQISDEGVLSQVVPRLFTSIDVLEIGLALILMTATAVYLIMHDHVTAADPAQNTSAVDVMEERQQRWEEVAKTLKEDEQTLYKAIIEDGIINQSELAKKTGLSKSSVSRALYGLESRGLIERKRHGMGNVVLLK
jgi:uncharacterized membrane protein